MRSACSVFNRFAMIQIYLLLIFLTISMQCNVPSFKNNIIEVNGQNQTISGCISPNTLQLNNPTKLFTIHVINQDIQDLNYGAVQGISNCDTIIFRNTSLKIIKERALMDLPDLLYVTLSSNKIKWIGENAFEDLPMLNTLYLHDNEITHVWPRSFNNLPQLKTVSFMNNKLENFDQSWFYKTPALLHLVLTRNRLSKISGGAFINLPDLRSLYCNRNSIEYVDKDAFVGLKYLTYLDLGENKLKSFDFHLYFVSKMMYVGIYQNNMTYISDDTLDLIGPTVKTLDIISNPLQCACLDKIIQWGDMFNVTILQQKLQEFAAVCVIPKTKPSQCIERSDEDFQQGFWDDFSRERSINSSIYVTMEERYQALIKIVRDWR